MAVPRPGIAAPPSRRWPDAPVALFGMVLGLGGLANCWRTAARLWGWSALPGEALALVAATVWGALLALYLGKWIWLPRAALAELRHPIGSSFVALAPIATAIASIAVAPYVPDTARTLMIAGVAGQTVAAIHAIAGILTGERDREATTPALYVPVVGGFLVSAIASAAFGFPEWGALFFGAGFLSWLALESVVVHRLLAPPALPVPLRATMGLHFTPPAVVCVAYLSVSDGPPGVAAQAIFGYALLHAAVGLRLLSWLREQPFGASYWAYTFGLSALPLAALRLAERGDTGPAATLALPLLLASSLAIAAIAAGTVRLVIQGRLISSPALMEAPVSARNAVLPRPAQR